MNATFEVCFNVWIFVDPGAGVVQTAAAKAYALAGTDAEKRDMLRRLAPTDFHSAARFPVPQRHVLIGPQGQQIAGGIPEARVLEVPGGPLVITTTVEGRPESALPAVLKRAEGRR